MLRMGHRSPEVAGESKPAPGLIDGTHRQAEKHHQTLRVLLYRPFSWNSSYNEGDSTERPWSFGGFDAAATAAVEGMQSAEMEASQSCSSRAAVALL